jgi:acyl-CoA thioesterase-2
LPERQTLDYLLDTLTPRALGENCFEAQNTHPHARRLYGGQVLAQCLRAAVATVDTARRVHSQHAYFLRPGDPGVPVTLEVESARDGGSFSSRRVVALQRGKPILVSSLSFQVPIEGDEFEPAMPEVPMPEGLQSERDREMAAGNFDATFQITTGLDLDIRVVEPVDWINPTARKPELQAWMRTTGGVSDAPGVHEGLLAYLSDTLLIDAALIAHGRSFHDNMQIASLDHALWFHDAFRADEWLLHVVEAQRVGGGRGLCRGRFYTRSGGLVATCMQESLMRGVQ